MHVSDLSSGNRELFGYLVDPKGYAAIAATDAFIELLNEYPNDVRLGLLKEDAAGEELNVLLINTREGMEPLRLIISE